MRHQTSNSGQIVNPGRRFDRLCASVVSLQGIAIAFAILLFGTLFLDGSGYRGKGDEVDYLVAARCWLQFGPCLPTNHWDARWPVIGLIAGPMAAFGETRAAATIPFLLIWAATFWLLYQSVVRLHSKWVASMTALLFLATPTVSNLLLVPRPEAPEFFAIVAAFAAVIAYQHDRRPIWPVLAAVALGFAFQVRDTAIVAVGAVCVVALVIRMKPIHIVLAAITFSITVAIEAVVFFLETGDPLYRRMLSVRYADIPTDQLRNGAPDGLPFFNPEMIGRWIISPGIYVHWAIDGLLNLGLNPEAGFSLGANVLLAPFVWSHLTPREKMLVTMALLVFTIFSLGLIYGLALDPEVRQLLPLMLCSTFILSIQLGALARIRKTVGIVAIGSLAVALALVMSARQWSIAPHEKYMTRVFGEKASRIEADETVRDIVALVPGNDQLRPIGSGQPELLVLTRSRCANSLEDVASRPVKLVREISLMPYWPKPDRFICHLRYTRPLPFDQFEKLSQ